MKFQRYFRFIICVLVIAFSCKSLMAQNGPPQYVTEAVKALEAFIRSSGDSAIAEFIDNAMTPATRQDRPEMIKHLERIRAELRGFWDDVAIEKEPDGLRLILSSGSNERQLKVILGPEGISDLFLAKASEPLRLNRDNLAQTIDQFEEEGMAGIIYVKLDGNVLLQRAFGSANPELGITNSLNTIFGIGSRPIDFTIAAIQLLAQKELIDPDDSIGKYFENVPSDKKPITIRHLLSGQSGLPDFFHTETDWDPDLAWIDRQTAEQRIMSQKLLFQPGEGREHSHAAFVLLAALVERVSGISYPAFLWKHFFKPAGMQRTGEYGESLGLSISDFAAGGGPQKVGVPNIPPNWGPTSWLIKGSGGMFSTLGDLQKFYALVRSNQVLDSLHNQVFRRTSVNLDGSERGFELFSIYDPPGNEVYLFLNKHGGPTQTHKLFRALEHLTINRE